MTNEEKISVLESRVHEQEQLLKELYQHAVNQQSMINDLKAKQLDSQENFVSLSGLVMTILKRLGLTS
jgi:uncharacterized coiled-coil protein SlyX